MTIQRLPVGLTTTMVVFILLGGARLATALEVVVVTADGEPVANAAVAVYNTGLPLKEAPAAKVDQRDRQFAPLVSAVQAGTLVRFPNSDDIRHHVYSFSPAKQFELKLYHGTTADPVRFGAAGKVVLGCNIHDSMLGYIYVFDTPVFTVTDGSGVATFPDVTADSLRVEVHHPWVDTSESRADVAADQQVEVQMGPLQGDPRITEPRSELESLFN